MTRATRILFIGNIANNAYLNAKILRRRGIWVDVLVHDYYHIMSWPEWEEVDFHGQGIDENYPDFEMINPGDSSRPRWFVQGPLVSCLRYLKALETGLDHEADVLWEQLQSHRARVCRMGRRTRGIKKWLCLPWFFVGKPLIRALHRTNCMLSRQTKRGFRQEEKFGRHVEELVEMYQHAFPERDSHLSYDDLRRFREHFEQWCRILDRYDVVCGYATDGIYPLLCGKRPYIAYEHGTIRSIPFG